MEAAPYDNVEFGPIQRGGGLGAGNTGTWPGPQPGQNLLTQHQQQQQTSRTLQHQQHQQQHHHHHGAKGLGLGAVGVGLAGSRLAPLHESNAEAAESRDQRSHATSGTAVTQQQHHLGQANTAGGLAGTASSSFSTGSSSAVSQSTSSHRSAGVGATTGLGVGSGGVVSSTAVTGQPQHGIGSAGRGGAGITAGGNSNNNNNANNNNTVQLLSMSAITTTTQSSSSTTTTTSTTSNAFPTSTASTTTTKTTETKQTSRNNAAPTYMLTQYGSGGGKDTGTNLRSGDDDVDFKRHDLDPTSRRDLEKAYTQHGEFYRLNSKVLDEGALLKQDVLDIYRKAGESFSYEQLLQGMLEDGEMLLLGGCWLHYNHVEFKDETGERTVRQPYGRGRVCLTNHRVLLLSADVYTDANMEPYGNVNKHGGYKLEVSKRNSVVFRNLPLSCFHSAELEVNIGTSAQTKITPRAAPCCGLCSCFGACCGQRWHSTPPMTRTFNERVVRMGVALPPWGARSILVLHLDPGQSLTTARDFVAQLHQHSPNMH